MAGANKLIVGNLPFDITEEDLHTVFTTYGEVTEVQILSEDKATGLRYAYISYRETKAGEDAITVLNEAYKIRTDAQQAITVAWDKQDGGAATGTQGGNGDYWGSQDSGGAWGSSAGGSSNSGGGNTKPPEDAFKLFVGGLPEDITEEELRTVFGTYGEVVHVHIMKTNSVTGLRGAFIYYSKKQAAEDAIKVLDNEYKIREGADSPIQVRWSKDTSGQGQSTESHRLFVGNLPTDIREDELKTVFSAYGELNTVHLMAPHAKTNMRAALVFYAKRESGEDAIKFLNENYRFREDGDPIAVKWGKEKESWNNDKGKGGGKWGGGGGGSWGGSSSWSDSGWSAGGKGGGGGSGWQAIGNGGGWSDRSAGSGGWSAQSSWGSSTWQDNSWSDNSSGWGGGGKGWSSSDGGWGKGGDMGGGGGYDMGGGGYDMGGGSYDMGGGYEGSDKGKGKGSDYGSWGKGKPTEEPSTKLYIANLPEDIQDNALEYVFGTYGKVQKVHIMNQKTRGGAVSAFVEFTTNEEAETAIASLHEKYEIRPGQGMIQVKHAYRRPRPY